VAISSAGLLSDSEGGGHCHRHKTAVTAIQA